MNVKEYINSNYKLVKSLKRDGSVMIARCTIDDALYVVKNKKAYDSEIYKRLKEADIDLEGKTFTVRASKTNAGIRTVPIADKVYHLWQKYMVHGWGLTYQTVKKKWDAYNESIGMEHTPHDARHTAISRMSAAHVNYVIIKKIVGHKTGDVTEDIYTHFSMDELRDAINKI